MVHKSEWIWPPTVFIDTLKENSWNMDELHWFNLNIHAMISISKQNLITFFNIVDFKKLIIEWPPERNLNKSEITI